MEKQKELRYKHQIQSSIISYKYIIEERVLWILEQYHPRVWSSRLKINNPNNLKELERWQNWVIWIIKSELTWQWFWNFSQNEILNFISNYLHEYFKDDIWYQKYLINILPKLNIEN